MEKNYIKILLLLLLLIASPIFIFNGCSDDSDTEVSKGEELYYCPMHPEVQSDKPGVCPICHMDLVLKDNDGDDMAEHEDNQILLNDRKIALASVSLSEIKSEELTKELTVYSYLDFAEQNRKIITAKFSGRIEKLYVDRTGDYIKKGQPLFEIYSPDLIQAQNDYLIALTSFKNITASGNSSNNLAEASRQKLLLLGVTPDQINELKNTEQVKMTLTYYSPSSGTVIEKKVQEGMYVNEGSTIYDIADLSELWNISEIFADDIGLIKKGSIVKLRLQAYPEKEFTGKVDLIYPVINSETRTIKIRSIFPNRDNLLKPNMFGDAVFSIKIGKPLVIPAGAVIFTGKRSIVWVQTEKGKFEMREIRTGYKVDDKYQVLSGLKEGEIVASEGTYLIDSESQLRSGMSSQAHQEHNTAPINKEENIENHKNHSELIQNKSIFNQVCPVLGNEVPDDAVSVVYNGKKIGFCCPGCDKEFLSDPEKYMKNLSPDGKVFNKKS